MFSEEKSINLGYFSLIKLTELLLNPNFSFAVIRDYYRLLLEVIIIIIEIHKEEQHSLAS